MGSNYLCNWDIKTPLLLVLELWQSDTRDKVYGLALIRTNFRCQRDGENKITWLLLLGDSRFLVLTNVLMGEEHIVLLLAMTDYFIFAIYYHTRICCKLHGFFPEIKRPKHEADHSLPSSTEAKDAWSYNSTRAYVFLMWCLIKYLTLHFSMNM
jgi:hypothetical protein